MRKLNESSAQDLLNRTQFRTLCQKKHKYILIQGSSLLMSFLK